MTLLYGRRISLVVAGDDGHGLDLSELHIMFGIRMYEKESPGQADIRIFNMKAETALKMKKEYTQVILQAGYGDLFGKIFRGTIVQSIRGRTNPVDTYVDVIAADGDQALNNAVVNTTVAAGATPSVIHGAVCTTMDPHGVQVGYTDPLVGPALPRGRALYGMARDHLRDLAQATDTTWNITDGKVQFVSNKGYLPGEAVVLTAATGLIGLPQQTMDGIMVRCLLNPLLKIGGRVEIKNSSITQLRLPVFYQAGADGKPVPNPLEGLIPKLDSVGIYRILAIDYSGDTRGQNWYCDLACMALDGTVPIAQAQRNRTLPPGT